MPAATSPPEPRAPTSTTTSSPRSSWTINAGRDFLLDGTSNVRTGAFGGVVGSPVVITAGRNINLTNTTGGLQTIEAFQGNITLTTGPGGTYSQNTAFAATVQTTNDIFLNADNVVMFSAAASTRPASGR